MVARSVTAKTAEIAGAGFAHRSPGADNRAREQRVRRLQRFTHMDIDPYAFASALNGIWRSAWCASSASTAVRNMPPDDENAPRSAARMPEAAMCHCGVVPDAAIAVAPVYRGRKAIAEILF